MQTQTYEQWLETNKHLSLEYLTDKSDDLSGRFRQLEKAAEHVHSAWCNLPKGHVREAELLKIHSKLSEESLFLDCIIGYINDRIDELEKQEIETTPYPALAVVFGGTSYKDQNGLPVDGSTEVASPFPTSTEPQNTPPLWNL